MDKAKARAALEELLSGSPEEATIAFGRICERYLREGIDGLDTVRDIRRIVGRLATEWGDRPAGTITTEDAANYRAKRMAEVTRRGKPPAPQTLDNELSLARRVLNWSVDQKLLSYNGLARVQLVRPNNVQKTKIKTEEDLQLLLECCPDIVRALVLVYLDSGLRRMEAINLQWPHLEVWHRNGRRRGIVELFDTKNGESRRSGLSDRALQALLDLPRVSDRWIFANRKTKRRFNPRWLYKLFERAVAESGLVGVDGEAITFHTLRRSFAYLRRVRDRAPERTVMRQGGWKDRKVFYRYGIDDDDETVGLYDLVDDNIDKAKREERAGRAEWSARRGPLRVVPTSTGDHTDTHVGQIVKGVTKK